MVAPCPTKKNKGRMFIRQYISFQSDIISQHHYADSSPRPESRQSFIMNCAGLKSCDFFLHKRKVVIHYRDSQTKLPLFSSSRQWSITAAIATTHRSLSIGCHGRLGSWISKRHYFILCRVIQERIIVYLSAIRFHLMKNFSRQLLLLLYKNALLLLL